MRKCEVSALSVSQHLSPHATKIEEPVEHAGDCFCLLQYKNLFIPLHPFEPKYRKEAFGGKIAIRQHQHLTPFFTLQCVTEDVSLTIHICFHFVNLIRKVSHLTWSI